MIKVGVVGVEPCVDLSQAESHADMRSASTASACCIAAHQQRHAVTTALFPVIANRVKVAARREVRIMKPKVDCDETLAPSRLPVSP